MSGSGHRPLVFIGSVLVSLALPSAASRGSGFRAHAALHALHDERPTGRVGGFEPRTISVFDVRYRGTPAAEVATGMDIWRAYVFRLFPKSVRVQRSETSSAGTDPGSGCGRMKADVVTSISGGLARHDWSRVRSGDGAGVVAANVAALPDPARIQPSQDRMRRARPQILREPVLAVQGTAVDILACHNCWRQAPFCRLRHQPLVDLPTARLVRIRSTAGAGLIRGHGRGAVEYRRCRCGGSKIPQSACALGAPTSGVGGRPGGFG